MTLPRYLLLLVLTPALLPAAAPSQASTPAEAPTRMLADFREQIPNAFNYGTWEGKAALTPAGTLVQGGKGATGKGELGASLDQSLDLSTATYIELGLAVGVANQVPVVTVAFDDENDVQYSAQIRIDQVLPQQPVWFRVKRSDFKLNDWQKKGAKSIDWKNIRKWHLQGDWATEAPFHVVFIAMRTRH
jgi:hypothetical protein